MKPSLNWSDPVAVSRWLGALRLAFNDADAVTADMLRPPPERELGPALHAATYGAARAVLLFALAFARAPEPDQEPSDPAGAGGAGPSTDSLRPTFLTINGVPRRERPVPHVHIPRLRSREYPRFLAVLLVWCYLSHQTTNAIPPHPTWASVFSPMDEPPCAML